MASNNGRTPLDLVDPKIYAPRLRRLGITAVGVGVVVAVGAHFLLGWPVAILIGVIVGGPTAVYALLLLRRRMWLSGNVIHARRFFRTRKVDVSRAERAEIDVVTARVSQVAMTISDPKRSQQVPLAMYTDSGSGRELDVVALRGLADALASSEIAAGAAVSSVLVHQLRAEARDAVLGERPLFRAFMLVRKASDNTQTTLTDREVATLID